MTSNRCLLCLQVVDTGEESDDDKCKAKIKVATMCQLLAPSRPKDNPTSYHDQFDEDEICYFCPDCHPVVAQIEEIRHQISLLEGQVEQKIVQIKEAISNYPLNGGDRLMEIRNLILRRTGAEIFVNVNQDDDNFVQNEFRVKVEHEIDHGDDHQFFDDCSSYGETTFINYEPDPKKEGSNDPLGDLEDEDSEFCITPFAQKMPKGRKKTSSSRAVRGKMKRSISRELKRKRIKREPRPVLEPTRSSSRVRKTVLPPPVEVKKILKVSLERILPVKKPQKVRPYKCTSCTKSFLTSDTLTYHIGRIHSGIPCPTCDAKFSSIKEKDAHMTRVHNIAPYACSLCGNKFYKASRLQVHLFTRHEDGEKKFSCAKCDRSFALEQNFERHVKFHELDGIKPIVCDVCDCRFKDEETRDTHKATHIPKYQCDHCGKRCQSKQMLARHVRSHTREMAEKCSICDAPFRDKPTVQRHIARDHSNTPPSHICHICGKAFYLPYDLTNHLYRHDGKWKVTCETCGETLPNKTAFQAHLVKMHGADPLVCEECGATFATPLRLKKHKKSHLETRPRPYECDICNRRYLTNKSLKEHRTSHFDERHFPCPHCEKSFKTWSQRSKHVKRIHTDFVRPTPHKCPHCDKAYPRKSYLEGHIRSAHTGERPFICDECGTGFVLQTMLNQHLKVSHGVGVTAEKKERLPRSKRDVDVLKSAGQDSD
ncbi:zinc finger protein 345 isoform X2 [Folsomia candida]|uniref:zinc finger protein 345 isoform X2 n=1 Tax=Folsomia candida TaxID=158441 RepID=UPI000B8F8934|nr:zinc finger protein 345 isoform X2 [Folsomia candida]